MPYCKMHLSMFYIILFQLYFISFTLDFRQADINGDGRLSFDEIIAIFKVVL